MPKRRIIVHPDLGFKYTLKPPPFLQMDAYLLIVNTEHKKKLPRVYHQIYTFGEYGIHTDHLWRWEACCRCGVWYDDPDVMVVRRNMKEHIQRSGHEPGSVYNIPGRLDYIERKDKKHGARTSSLHKASR